MWLEDQHVLWRYSTQHTNVFCNSSDQQGRIYRRVECSAIDNVHFALEAIYQPDVKSLNEEEKKQDTFRFLCEQLVMKDGKRIEIEWNNWNYKSEWNTKAYTPHVRIFENAEDTLPACI